MKFRSLIFREIKLSRRIIILQSGLLLAWVALTWGALLSADANKLTDEELLGVSSAVVVMMPLIAALPMLINNDFKSDINSGWLGYSYALPISPLERTAARFSVRYAVCAVNVLLGLCDAAAVLAYSGNTLSSEHIVWYIVVFAAAILYSLPNDIMLLRSRSAADMKKMQTAAGMTEVAIMAVLVVALMKINGVKLQDIAEGNDKGFMDNTFFSAGSLLWAVPLLLALTAANFFASYRSLSSAYPLVRKAEREPAETRAAVASRTDGVKGLLYKELKQNRLMLIFAALVPLLLTAFPFCFSAIGVMTGGTGVDEMFETATNIIMRVLMFVTGFFIVSGMMTEVFRGDGKKLWAYFVVSLPQGVKEFMYRKYLVTLMMNLIYAVSFVFAENLLATVNYFVTGEELTTNLQGFYLSGVFLLMFTSAFDIPFTVRYGSQKGSMVKMITMLSICTAAIAVYNMLPENIAEIITKAAVSLFNGEANDTLLLIASLLPYIALAAFLLSYRTACGVFMKGVNEYDK